MDWILHLAPGGPCPSALLPAAPRFHFIFILPCAFLFLMSRLTHRLEQFEVITRALKCAHEITPYAMHIQDMGPFTDEFLP